MRNEINESAATLPAWHARTSWVGPPVNDSLSFSNDRVWRWAPGEVPPPRSVAQIPDMVRELSNPAGFTQPGLCLIDPGGAAVCAVGRQPRLQLASGKDPSWTQQAVLVPAEVGWSVAAISEERFNETLVRGPSGAELARVDKPGWARGPAIGRRDTVTAEGRTWRLVARSQRFGGLFGKSEIVGAALVDPTSDAVHAEVSGDPGRQIAGDITIPFTFSWRERPRPAELWVVLLVVSAIIDSDHPGHLD